MLQRIRTALVVVLIAGTILNVWTTLDALAHMSHTFMYDTATVGDIFDPPPRPNPYDDVIAQKGWNPIAGLAAAERLEHYKRWRDAVDGYNERRTGLWEQAAKIEFGLIVLAAIVWVFVRPAKSPKAS